jgi:hypothetical protein
MDPTSVRNTQQHPSHVTIFTVSWFLSAPEWVNLITVFQEGQPDRLIVPKPPWVAKKMTLSTQGELTYWTNTAAGLAGPLSQTFTAYVNPRTSILTDLPGGLDPKAA